MNSLQIYSETKNPKASVDMNLINGIPKNNEKLVFVLENLLNKKDLQINDILNKAKEMEKADPKLAKNLKGVAEVAKNAQDDDEFVGLSIGSIIAFIVKFIKKYTQSIKDFGNTWNNSINSTLSMGITAANTDCSSKQWAAFGAIATGVVGLVGAGVAATGGILGSISAFGEFGALEGVTLDEGTSNAENIGENGIISETKTEQPNIGNIKGDATTKTDVTVGKDDNVVTKEDPVVNRNTNETGKTENTEAEEIAANKEELERKKKMIEKKYARGRGILNAMAQSGNAVGQAGGAGDGLCRIPSANLAKQSATANAVGGSIRSRSDQAQRTTDTAIKTANGTMDLMQYVNNYIKANIAG
jgi:uncharacterized membrane-anchored protein YhcB (DUF1043 family)